MKLTRNRLRRMILKEMDVMGVNVNPQDIELVVTAMAATGALLTTGVSQLVMNVMDVLESKYGEIKKADRNALKSTVKEYIEQHSIEGTPMSPTVGDPISSSVIDTIPDVKPDSGIPFYATPEAFGDHAVVYGDNDSDSGDSQSSMNESRTLTRNRLRRMILKEMDMMGGGMVDSETIEMIIGTIKVLGAAGALAGIHIAIVLEQLARMHANIQKDKNPDIDEENFVTGVKDAVKNASERDPELSQYIGDGMGVDPDNLYEKPQGDDYEMYDPYGDGTEGDRGEYQVDMGEDFESLMDDPHLSITDMGLEDDPLDYRGGDIQSDRMDEAYREYARSKYDDIEDTEYLPDGPGFPGSYESLVMSDYDRPDVRDRLHTQHLDDDDGGSYRVPDQGENPDDYYPGEYDDYEPYIHNEPKYAGRDHFKADRLSEARRLRRRRLRRRR